MENRKWSEKELPHVHFLTSLCFTLKWINLDPLLFLVFALHRNTDSLSKQGVVWGLVKQPTQVVKVYIASIEKLPHHYSLSVHTCRLDTLYPLLWSHIA